MQKSNVRKEISKLVTIENQMMVEEGNINECECDKVDNNSE